MNGAIEIRDVLRSLFNDDRINAVQTDKYIVIIIPIDRIFELMELEDEVRSLFGEYDIRFVTEL